MHLGQPRADQVGSAAGGHDCPDQVAEIGGGPQGGSGAGAGAEEPNREAASLGLGLQPVGRPGQPVGQQLDVEHLAAVGRLGRGEQVQQQRGQPALVQGAGDLAVTGAVAAAA